MITDKAYDQLKFLGQILLPAMGVSYFAYAQIWGVPNIEKALGFIFVVNLFLGVLLSLSQARHNKEVIRGGVLMVVETEEGELFTLELADDPEVLKTKREVRFDIRKE
jgi:hypothetical protein